MKEKEIWKTIKRYPTVEISNLGNVRSKVTKEAIATHPVYFKGMCFKLYEGDKEHNISRLLAETFIDDFNPDEMKVEFKDGDWKNVVLDNIVVVPKKNSKLNDDKLDKIDEEKEKEDDKKYRIKKNRQLMTLYYNDPHKLFIKDSKSKSYIYLQDETMYLCRLGKFDVYMSQYGRVWQKVGEEFLRVRPTVYGNKEYVTLIDSEHKRHFFVWNYLYKVLITVRKYM